MSSSSAIGIISGVELKQSVQTGVLVAAGSEDRVQGSSYDMTVGTIFWQGRIIPMAANGATPEQITVPPGGIVSIFTAEELRLPPDVCATAFAINRLSSRGFLVLNPGHVDPGFEGPLTVKALNVRKTPIAIQQGEPVFTVVFERLSAPTSSYGENKSRGDREREFNAQTVETSPASLSEIIENDPSGPYPTRAEVNELIRGHALSWLSLWAGLLALLAALVAAVTGILALIDRPAIQAQPTGQVAVTAAAGDLPVPPGKSPMQKGEMTQTQDDAAQAAGVRESSFEDQRAAGLNSAR